MSRYSTASGRELFHELQPMFNALGDETRQNIVYLLGENQRMSVKELAAQTDLSRPAVSHHLKILREAGLVDEERDGTKRYYHPVFERHAQIMRELLARLEHPTLDNKKEG